MNIFAPASVPGEPPAPSEAVKGPSGVRFAYVAATRDEVVGKTHLAPYGDRGEEWQPSPADDRQIGMLAPIVAGSSRFIPYPLTVNDTLPEDTRTPKRTMRWSSCWSMSGARAVVAKYQTLLRKCDKVNSANCATLVVWNEQDPDLASERAQLENLLQYRCSAPPGPGPRRISTRHRIGDRSRGRPARHARAVAQRGHDQRTRAPRACRYRFRRASRYLGHHAGAPEAATRQRPTGSVMGQIVTFYSYKGGTGRTMAMANAAWILAADGHRVLTVDWDLEAPGLHRYLHPFLRQGAGGVTGIIDI